LGRCFIDLTTTFESTAPYRHHVLQIVYDAIDGNEVAKLETLSWFDEPMTAGAPMHEAFRLNGNDIADGARDLLDFRALMTK
jgi:hypothetical protein